MDFAVLADHRIKLKENEKKENYLEIARELKKLWNMKVTIIPMKIGAFGKITKGLIKALGGLGGQKTSGDHSNYNIIENGQNTEKSPGDLLSFKIFHSSGKPSANADVKNSQGIK